MSNPLYSLFGGMNQIPTGGLAQVLQQVSQFKSAFRGDPRQQVQELLNSGKVTQEQYNRAVQMANYLQSMIK